MRASDVQREIDRMTTTRIVTDSTNCYKCGTELINAPGIGPFCPNKECDVVDATSGNKIDIQT